MTTRSQYKTKQREVLMSYLEQETGGHITAGDVVAYFKQQGTPIAQATIYRQLEKLVDEGVLNKYIIDANSPACFEYVGEASHGEGEACFHCKCEACGRLIHLHCQDLSAISGHLLKEHGFRLNPLRTVFYGLCETCAREAKRYKTGAKLHVKGRKEQHHSGEREFL